MTQAPHTVSSAMSAHFHASNTRLPTAPTHREHLQMIPTPYQRSPTNPNARPQLQRATYICQRRLNATNVAHDP